MTTQELLNIPDDGIDRDLSRGKVRSQPHTYKCRPHSRTTTRISSVLSEWLDPQARPRGEVLSGGPTFGLHRDPDTTITVDVAYIGPELCSSAPGGVLILDGIPTLAIEIWSPTDTMGFVYGKVLDLIQTGVPMVWLVETVYKTITVYEPDAQPRMFTVKDELTAEPQLPGFRVRVAQLFE